MEDKDKTKEQLVAELAELRQRLVELEAAESDHKQEELKQYQFMVESAHDVIFFKDMKSRYIIANNRTLEAFGLSREEVIGKNDYEIMPDKKEAKKNVEDDQEVFNTGKPREIIKHMTGVDGKEYWFQAIKVPHVDAAGNITGLVGIARNITERKEAEEAIREKERFFTSVLDEMITFLAVLKPDGEIVFVNNAPLKVIGKSLDQVIGMKFYDIDWWTYSEDTRQLIKEDLERCASGENIYHEVKIQTKDGHTWIDFNTHPILGEDGSVQYLIPEGRDITERKQTEDLYKSLAESSLAAVFIVQDGKFRYINTSAVEYAGYTAEKLIGRHSDIIVHPEDREMVKETGRQMLLGETSSPYEFRMVTKKGRIRWIMQIVSPIQYEGKPAVLGNAIDITEKKQAEEALRESEEKYHSLVSTEDFMYLVDRDCGYIFMNEGYRERYGLDLNEVTEKIYADFHSKDQVKDFSAGVARVFETSESIQNEVRSNVDGRYFLKTLSPVKDKDGKITAVTVVAKDITKRKQAEKELERHREHLRLINQILRHDIINDLAAVKSGLRLYKDSGDEGLLDDITKKVDKSVELIRETKELESFISSHKDLKFYNVKDVIKKVIENYGSIKFTIEGKGRVLADETLGSVIDNIIRNAIDHGKTDRIDITIDKQQIFCEVRIADYGVGIPDKMKEKIFEEGFRYGGTGHTGLGLYIVKKAMESYGGSAHVEDNSPAGAVFMLKLRRVR